MRIGRLKAMAVKETLQVWRDPRSLMIALLMPAMQMLLLGYGFSLDIKHIPVCTYDRENSQQSQALLKHFQASQYFDIVRVVGNYPELTRAVDAGNCRLAVVVPPDFTEQVSVLGSGKVQAIVDATDDNTAQVALGYAQAVVAGFAAEVQLDATGPQVQAAAMIQPLSVEPRVWFNEDLESRNFIIPGVVAMVMALVGAQLTSLTVSREWERGTMELLVSTPVTPLEVMLGKLIPYFAISFIDATLCLVFAVFWFAVPFRGDLLTLFLTTAMFSVVVLGIGYLISVTIRNQLGASQIALLVTMLPTTLLSGFAFPIDQMPGIIQVMTYFVYSRYYVTILKSVFLKGLGLGALAMPVLAMAIYSVAVAALAARAFHKSLD